MPVSAQTAGGGTIAFDNTNSPYPSGSTLTVTATPSAGWTFLHWLGGASGTNPSTTVKMNANKCVEAVFGTTLGTTAAGNGSLSLNPLLGLYPYGTGVRVTAVPQSSNYFVIWGNAASGNANPLNYTVTSANRSISSLFGALPTNAFTLTVLETGLGTAVAVPQMNLYTNGQPVTVTATPGSDQDFLGWGGDASGTQNPLPVTMGPNKVIAANFTRRPRLVPPTCVGPVGEDGFWFTLTGEFGGKYQILGSTNLLDWTSLGTVTNTYGTVQFTDGAATNLQRRFYRATSF